MASISGNVSKSSGQRSMDGVVCSSLPIARPSSSINTQLFAGYRSHSHQIPDLFVVVSHSDSPPTTMVLHSHTTSMTEQEFRNWLQRVDVNGDGRISRHELSQALRVLGVSWTTFKSWSAMRDADLNHNHYIDGESEIKKLKEYAAKHWNILVKA